MTSRPTHWNPSSVPTPIGKYSHLTRVPAGSDLIFIAGQVGNDAAGNVADGAYAQTLATFRNIETLLATEDLEPKDLVRLLSFVSGSASLPGYYEARDEIYAEWFADGVFPGHSLAVVAALANPAILVELEGWASAPPGGGS